MEPSARSVAGGLLNCRNISTVPGKKKRKAPSGRRLSGDTRARKGALQRVAAVPRTNVPGNSGRRRLLDDQR
jgi:hypothetical protein